MKEDFVTFELAKKLKDKGYPQVEKNTLAMYDEDGCLSCLCPTFDINRYYYCFEDFDKHGFVAPTIYQVLKWLREEKGIHIMIDIWKVDLNNTTYKWGYDIVNLTTTHVDGCDTHCANSFEQAALAGIKYVLDNLI